MEWLYLLFAGIIVGLVLTFLILSLFRKKNKKPDKNKVDLEE